MDIPFVERVCVCEECVSEGEYKQNGVLEGVCGRVYGRVYQRVGMTFKGLIAP